MEKSEFRIYNTMTQQKETFIPKDNNKVGMYVCGITAYDLSHLGHARAAVSFDILYRYLQHLGYEVTYVRNFTDVDDKIIRRANELGEDPFSLSSRYCDEFIHDMNDLQCRIPTEQPRVSKHIDQIKDMISQILGNDCAYVVDGDVYFSVDKSPNYGRLSGQKVGDNRAGERVAVDSRKRNPADFALWKAAKPDEPSWDSPWGKGRPGWHIECSAMSAHYLSFTFDIHGGGIDLIFPHHENEIAQSCAACEESNIKYWMHNGHVTNNNEKMSKSLGNFFTIREISKLYHPLALRYFLLSAHYRSPINYSISQLEKASGAVYYIYQTLQDCEVGLHPYRAESQEVEPHRRTAEITSAIKDGINKLSSDFKAKMSDDLQTPPILTGALTEGLRLINSSLPKLKANKQKQQQLSIAQSLKELEREVKGVLEILGLLSSLASLEVMEQFKDKALKRAELSEAELLQHIEERMTARKNKDYSRSDQIRIELLAKGIKLMDEGGKTSWMPHVVEEQQQVVEEQKPTPAHVT